MASAPYGLIADALAKGKVVPFFGAAASAVYRPKDTAAWSPGRSQFMPFGGELATALAEAASYPAPTATGAALDELLKTIRKIADKIPIDEAAEAELEAILRKYFARPPDLAAVASYAEMQGDRKIVDMKLRDYFKVECEPGLLQTMLAGIANIRLYITTNYDDLLERALAPRNPFVLVDRGADRGLLVGPAGKTLRPVSPTGKDLHALFEAEENLLRPIIFKMHGSIDRSNENNDCYLITEEDYVDFLGRTRAYVPPYITALMDGKNLLFLGHSLADWNVRVIMRKLLKRTKNPTRFWAVVNGHSEAEQEIWDSRDLKIFAIDLVAFAEALNEWLKKVAVP